METKLQSLVDRNQVFFTGIRRDVHKYYNAADFLISPSVHENHSMTILEACASGIPTLATRTGGTPEIVKHRGNGLLVESLSHHELAAGIRHMLRNRSLWEEWGRNALTIAQTMFTSQHHNSQLNSIYSRLLNS
jgi:glycosyltransferase involved in cell wall biosynthesis